MGYLYSGCLFCVVVSVVNVAGRQYFLQAEDGKSMTVWIDALNRAGKISVSSVIVVANEQARNQTVLLVSFAPRGVSVQVIEICKCCRS